MTIYIITLPCIQILKYLYLEIFQNSRQKNNKVRKLVILLTTVRCPGNYVLELPSK